MKSRILNPEKFFQDFIDFFDKNRNNSRYFKTNKNGSIAWTEWTAGIEKIMKDIANKNNISFRGHHKKNYYASKMEFLGVDFNFFKEEEKLEELNANNFPIISVEHENKLDRNRIIYNFNKLINLRSPIKVLICYVTNGFDGKGLIRELAEFSKDVQNDGKFLIIIGNSTIKNSDEYDGFIIYPSGFWKKIA